jgi:AraC-like DNA-binding protein
MHEITWPDISERDEMQELEQMKNERINGKVAEAKEDDNPSPDDVARQTKIDIAQHQRNQGKTISTISDNMNMSEGWVSNNTSATATDGGEGDD